MDSFHLQTTIADLDLAVDTCHSDSALGAIFVLPENVNEVALLKP